jgi:hypothetical protein
MEAFFIILLIMSLLAIAGAAAVMAGKLFAGQQ